MVYLIHFDTRYRHAQHYIGYTGKSVAARLRRHENCTGARLMAVVTESGITWQLARTWPDGNRSLERRLKRWHGSAKLCPICKAERVSGLPL